MTLGGAGETFSSTPHILLNKEIDVLGSRYVSPLEILETYDLMVRGEVWPIVTEIRPMEEAEIVHDLVERGEVTGRAALVIG